MRRKIGIVMATVMLLSVSLPVRAAGSETMTEQEVAELSSQIGQQYAICPELLQAIAWKESRYDPAASSEGCEGLMQIQSKWHADRMERLGITDLYDPESNMLLAADYLAELSAQYDDVAVVLMYYNGDRRAKDLYQGTGEISDYAEEILYISSEFEIAHGK